MSQLQTKSFLISSDDAELAQRTLQEVRDRGGNADHISFHVGDLPPEEHHDILTPYEPCSNGIMGLRHECRQVVLSANGADITAQVRIEDQLKALGIETNWFCAIRDGWGRIEALGHPRWLMTPLIHELLQVRPTNRTWNRVEVWHLFYASVIEAKNRLVPQAKVFLFTEEWETLKREGKLLTYNYHDVYNEIFEGFVLRRGEDDEEAVLWKVCGYLLD